MKLAIHGSYGSGKTTQLKKIAKQHKNPFYITNYSQFMQFIESIAGKEIIISELMNDYVLFIIYKKAFENRGYSTFSKFLKHVKQLFDYINFLGISIDEIQSQNKLFNVFQKEYINARIKLNNYNFIFSNQILNRYFNEIKEFFSNYDALLIDDIESFPLNQLHWLLNLHKNIIITYTSPLLTNKLTKNGFEIKTLLETPMPETTKLKVNSIPLFILEKSLYNPSKQNNIAFYTKKSTRRKIENFLRTKKEKVKENMQISALYDYAINVKYFDKSIEKPHIWEILEKINKALSAHESYIFEFLENYEDIYFYTLPNIFSSPYELYGRKYKVLYVEENSLKNKPRDENILIPADFISFEIIELNHPYRNVSFYYSKAEKIILLEESAEAEIGYDLHINPSDYPEVLSFSQISTYEDCPYKYFLRYIYNLPEEPSPALIFGNIIHSLLEAYAKRKINATQLLKEFESAFYKHIDSFKTLAHYYLIKGKKMLKNFIKGESILLSDKYEDKGIEMKVNITLSNNIQITGKIDRIVKIKDKIFLIDYKTSKLSSENSTSYIKGSEQLILYSYILDKKYNIKVDKALLWYLENNKILEVDQAKDISKIIYKIKDISEKIKKGKFSPKPGPKCKTCSYKLICKYWQGVKKD